jgi:K+ transporter
MSDSPASELPADRPAGHPHHPQSGIIGLAIGAIGIVFGDIGTSPIYAFRETFHGHHQLDGGDLEILGVLSLIFWSMMIVVAIKYVTVIMRADNKGEGGSLALLALINRKSAEPGSGRRKWTAGIVLLGVFACALFYGDSMITPAISVLSAVEGLNTVQTGFEPYVVPNAIGNHDGLFAIQARGTAKVGALFGPIMIFYFLTISVLGVMHIADNPMIILHTINPLNAVNFFLADGWRAFLALGSVVLAVTGAEALYADMGHFGRKPIGISWLFFVMPALMLNYMGQGAMVLALDDSAVSQALTNPFFFLAPESLRLPLVILATFATIIASQAVISGAFSVTQQAMHLGFIPRLRIQHTSASAAGQIYIPVVNWALMIKRMNEAAMPASIFIKSAASSATRVPGTAVFMTTAPDGIPHALLHNLKHNKVLHERVILLTVKIEDVPYVEEAKTFHLDELGQGFYRLIVRYGFMQETNVPSALARVDNCGPQIKMMDTSFFLARQTLIASPKPGMWLWREKLFAWMLRNAESAMEFFNLPPNRVVELGSQVEI